MADPGVDGAPYDAALQLASWAAANLGYLEGRVTLAGLDPAALSAGQWLSITMVALVELGPAGGIEALDKLGEALAKPAMVSRDTWGLDTQAQAGQRAMMAQAGGPARKRSPDAQRPAAWQQREDAV